MSAIKSRAAKPRWEWCFVSTAGATRHRYGSVWRTWAVVKDGRDSFVVIHLPTGGRVTEFDRLAIARRFCERIDALTDWAAFDASASDPSLTSRMHRIALDLTNAKPNLRAIDGGAA